MLEFGSERDAQAFVKKTYLVLREGAKLIQRELVWLQRNYKAGVIPIVAVCEQSTPIACTPTTTRAGKPNDRKSPRH